MVYEPTYAGGVLQLFITYIADYFPYGKVLREYVNTGSGAERFLTTQHERDKETGLDYRGARYYDSDISRFLSIDPWQTKYPEWSTYNYVMGNPIIFIDPTGKGAEGINHIIVTKGKRDGTYVVKSGEANSDRGVYLDDGNGGKGTKVGTMMTTHSFFNEKNKVVVGAIIDTKSREGQNFIDNEIIRDHPKLRDYVNNATLNKHYDFKSRGLKEGITEQEALKHRTRGSMTSNGEMASARDFGNMGAGIVAARAGVPHWYARRKFNELQGGQEPPVSAKAQQIGLNIGTTLYNRDQAKLQFEKLKNGYVGSAKD
jgi:RHS repeat-associated protein